MHGMHHWHLDCLKCLWWEACIVYNMSVGVCECSRERAIEKRGGVEVLTCSVLGLTPYSPGREEEWVGRR